MRYGLSSARARPAECRSSISAAPHQLVQGVFDFSSLSCLERSVKQRRGDEMRGMKRVEIGGNGEFG